jgi:hypothetical protein
MNCSIVYKKTSYDPTRDGINAYHAEFFHGKLLNEKIDDNNLGDVLTIPLKLQKNAFNLRYIFQPQRNLVVPEGVKLKLKSFTNISFFRVSFQKLFFAPYKKGDFSLGPESYYDLEDWLASFKHEEGLRQEIEIFYELILPEFGQIKKEFGPLEAVEFNLKPWRQSRLDISKKMLQVFPAIWSTEGIIFRQDVFDSIEEFFCWDYFHKGQFTIDR